MSSRQSEIQDTIQNRDRIHVVMFFLSLLFLALGVRSRLPTPWTTA